MTHNVVDLSIAFGKKFDSEVNFKSLLKLIVRSRAIAETANVLKCR